MPRGEELPVTSWDELSAAEPTPPDTYKCRLRGKRRTAPRSLDDDRIRHDRYMETSSVVSLGRVSLFAYNPRPMYLRGHGVPGPGPLGGSRGRARPRTGWAPAAAGARHPAAQPEPHGECVPAG